MLCFPQLASGATIQFPSTKHVFQRTVVNQLLDGSEVKLFDPMARAVEWEISLAALTDAEWNAIAALFEAAEGRLGSFVFLDPFGNLLSWSEAPEATAWTKDAGLALAAGGADPLGGTGATRVQNTSGTSRNIAQTAGVPSGYEYCLSVYARSDTAGQVTAFVSAGTDSAAQSFQVGPAWCRLALTARLGAQQDSATFGVTIPGGATVDLFGFQAEPQAGASSYKKTAAQSGVYANASFADDVLAMTSDAPGIHSGPVRIRANAAG
jgi:hypothetical protein